MVEHPAYVADQAARNAEAKARLDAVDLKGNNPTPPVARNSPPSVGVQTPPVTGNGAADRSGPKVPGETIATVPLSAAPPVRVEKPANTFDTPALVLPDRLPAFVPPPTAATVDIGAPATFTHTFTDTSLPSGTAVAVFEEEILVKADKLTLVISAEKDGKLRLGSASWENGKVIMPGEALDLRWQGGQAVLVRRKPKAA